MGEKEIPFRSPFIFGEVCFRRFFAMAFRDRKEESCRNSTVAIVIPVLCVCMWVMQPLMQQAVVWLRWGSGAAGPADCSARTTGHSVSRSRRDEHESVIEGKREEKKLQQLQQIRSRSGWDEMLMLRQPYLRKQRKQENE